MKQKILVVDDHPETLDIIKSVLMQHEFNVFGALSGIRGLTIAEKEQPDLIMVDGRMPEMDGWEFCRRIRQITHLAETPIIMFSAIEGADQKLASFDAGADDYLMKPTEPDELIDRVEVLLNATMNRNHHIPSSAPFEKRGSNHTSLSTRHVGGDEPQKEAPAAPRKNQTIVVLGVRGGVGTTITAVNMAASLAALGIKTSLLDFDLNQGHVALYLKQKVPREAKHLANFPINDLPDQLPKALIHWNDHLQILPIRPNLLNNHAMYSSEQLVAIQNHLAALDSFTIIDGGLGTFPVMKPLLETADKIFVCLRAERIALAAARRFMILWQKSLFPIKKIFPLIVDFENGRDIPKQAIESYLGRPIFSVIPIQAPKLTQAINNGVPIVELVENSKTAVAYKQLALSLQMV